VPLIYSTLCKRHSVKYAWIKSHKCDYTVDLMCKLLDVGRSSYYTWLQAKPSARYLENQRLGQRIKEIFIDGRCSYGSRRIRRILQSENEIISRRRVGKLMKQLDLHCKTKKRFRVTTDSKHGLSISPNLLARNFSAQRTDEKYVGDITYIWTNEGWMYLAVVIDLFSRRVVGWAMDDNMKTPLVNNALLMALWSRKPKEGLLWHTDRGSQYASDSHREIINDHKIMQSMSRRGNCWDNAVAESFFHTLKTELTYHMSFSSREEASSMIFEYIEVFYNRKRLHSSNNYMSPETFELSADIC
jgi:putative transposase